MSEYSSSNDMNMYILIFQIVNLLVTSFTGFLSVVKFKSKCLGSEVDIRPAKMPDSPVLSRNEPTLETIKIEKLEEEHGHEHEHECEYRHKHEHRKHKRYNHHHHHREYSSE